MRALLIDGNRNGYTPEQCGRTATVRELIDMLSEFDDDMPIYLCNDNGYTYGSVDIWSMRDEEFGDDE